MAARLDPKVQIAPAYAAQQRATRRPQHKFNLRFRPYEIQPFLVAPVLPGETFTNMMLQAQCWSDPLKGTMRNIGWWLQYNLFYVRLRDFPENIRLKMAEMMLNPELSIAEFASPTRNFKHYTPAGGINWSEMCLQHVVENFFRDEGEDWDVATANGLPLAKIYGAGTNDAFKKMTLDADYEDARVDLDVDQDGKITVDEVSRAFAHHAAMLDAGLTDMDFEDYMRTYGSKVREDENSPNLHRAEDLWAKRDFTYPTNTIATSGEDFGKPAVGVGWRVQEHANRKIFCDEPGFLFGVTYVRPKVYLRGQLGSVASVMQNQNSWLPAILHDQFDVSHILQAQDEGPLAGVFEDDYWIDLADLFLHGDQFVNYDPAGALPFLNLPEADAQRRYAAESEIAQFFSDPAVGRFEMDGIASLSVLGRQREKTRSLQLKRA